jgi:cysteine rich repeat protein
MSYELLIRSAALASALVVSATTAWAAPGGAVREACAADIKVACASVKPGGGRIIACMREHADQLSPGCLQAIQSSRSAR